MTELMTIQKIAEDLDFLKEKVVRIEAGIEEITVDLHGMVKLEYLQKLKRIDAGKFLSEEEFERAMAEE